MSGVPTDAEIEALLTHVRLMRERIARERIENPPIDSVQLRKEMKSKFKGLRKNAAKHRRHI